MIMDRPISEIIDEAIKRIKLAEWGCTNQAREQVLIKLKEAKFWLENEKETFGSII